MALKDISLYVENLNLGLKNRLVAARQPHNTKKLERIDFSRKKCVCKNREQEKSQDV